MIPTGGFEFTNADIDETLKLISDTLRAGQVSYGPLNKRVETELAAKLFKSQAEVALCGSGTDALVASLLVCRIGNENPRRNKVVVPALTFVASANSVTLAGLEVVFCDIDEYYGLSVDGLRDILSARDDILAVMPVHLFGHPCDMQGIRQAVAEYEKGQHGDRIYIVEDCCESLGAEVEYGGSSVPVGTIGDFGAFSFYVAHHITSGVGGAVVTSDPRLTDTIRSVLNHGRDLSYWKRTGNIPNPATVYRFRYMGLSSRMTELQAALLIPQIPKIDDIVSRRREIVEYISYQLEEEEEAGLITLPSERDGAFSTWMFYPLVLSGKRVDRDTFARRMAERGVETRPAMPLLNQPVYNSMYTSAERSQWDFPTAKNVEQNGILLGSHQYLTDAQVKEMVTSAKEVLCSFAP